MQKDEPKVLFATTNEHKFLEAQSIMKEYGVELVFLARKGLEVQSDSIEEIANRSAVFSSSDARVPVVVEDAGLFVDALKGFPGPYSSYVFRTLGCDGILRLLEGNPDRKASFVSAVAFCEPNNPPICFSAATEGMIEPEARGSAGFGFDPIFMPAGGGTKTFAEMTVSEKNRQSHRAKAFRRFAEWYVDSKP